MYKRKSFQSPLRILFAVILANVLVEMAVMSFLSLVPSLTHFEELLLDTLLLLLFLVPLLIVFVYRPMNAHVKERQRVEDALRKSEEELRYLSIQILSAQEKERRRISRELHDEFGQALTLMKLQIRNVLDSLHEDQEIVKQECWGLLGYIDTTIENVRRVSRDLSPLVLQDLGLTAAIKWLVNNFVSTYNVSVASDIEDINNLFDEDKQIMIYRIVQEGLTNIGKHAAAGRVSLSFRRSGPGVIISLEDDGRGFAAEGRRQRLENGSGLGLAIMDERVSMIGGTITVASVKGGGTRVSISIPTNEGGNL